MIERFQAVRIVVVVAVHQEIGVGVPDWQVSQWREHRVHGLGAGEVDHQVIGAVVAAAVVQAFQQVGLQGQTVGVADGGVGSGRAGSAVLR